MMETMEIRMGRAIRTERVVKMMEISRVMMERMVKMMEISRVMMERMVKMSKMRSSYVRKFFNYTVITVLNSYDFLVSNHGF